MTVVSLIVAIADSGVIGNRGKIPWGIPEDMKHFKELTLGKPCIMGRKTWDSLPKKPLPDRKNIVVSRNRAFKAEGASVVSSFGQAYALAEADRPEEIMVIGGAAIYEEALRFAKRIYLTEVHRQVGGDTRFVLDRKGWRETSRVDRVAQQGTAYSFVTLESA